MSALTKFKRRDDLQIMKQAETIMVDGVPFTRKQIKALEREGIDLRLSTTRKDSPNSSTLTGPALNGPYQGNVNQWGTFSGPGVRPERFGVLPRPMSMMRVLIEDGALRRSEYLDEILEIMTGQTVGSGSNATGFCGTPPTAGQLQVMQRIFKFGSLFMKTQLNSVPQLGLLVNRADIPGRILNAGPEANPLIPDIMYQLTDTRSQLQTEMFNLGVEIERNLEQVTVVGSNSLASASTHRGWIAEFDGLDLQIKTGFTDAQTALASPAADSISENWQQQLVGGTQTSSGRNIVQLIADIYYGLIQRAASVGMEGFDLMIVMRPEFFRALTDVYACSYAIARCSNGVVGSPQIVDQTVINNLRLEMLNGQYLLIEGVKVPVVFSQGIPLTQLGSNLYQNSFYFVPVSWRGRPLINLEYFPMDNQYSQEYRSFISATRYRVLNNGLYLVGEAQTPMCLEFHFAARMRFILETPFLAARVDNMQFTYLAKSYSPYPGETFLYSDGGTSYRTPYYTGY